MRNSRARHGVVVAIVALGMGGPAVAQQEYVVRTPLVGFTGSDVGGGDADLPRVFTETRVWNPGTSAAHVRITEVVGQQGTDLAVTVPPQAIVGLRYFDMIARRPEAWAMVEFSSDQDIRVMTTVNISSLGCAVQTGSRFPAYTGGHCEGIGGPILQGFTDYVQPGEKANLGWLTTDTIFFRTNLFVINPAGSTLRVRIIYRSADGSLALEKEHSVAPRSLQVVGDVFADPVLRPLIEANGMEQMATASVSGEGPFYAFAAVRSKTNRPDSNFRFAIVQPDVKVLPIP